MTQTKKSLLLSLLVAFCAGAILWIRSDMPPYAHPSDEFSNNYWGFIVHIAHKWRVWSFPFWDREAGGGMCLFSMGQYPVFNPTNIFALFLDYGKFFLFKLIEPYCLGIFFMAFLLLEGFKVPVAIAYFGALSYMGIVIGRDGGSPMAQSPQFLYGTGLFPAMVYCSVRLKECPVLAATFVGVVMAFLFLGGGTTQLPQTLIWWIFFFTIYIFGRFTDFSFLRRAIMWTMTLFSLIFMTASFFGIQFIPTVFYALGESARISSGYHPINSFPIYPCTYFRCLSSQVWISFLGSEGHGYFSLFILCVALFVSYGDLVQKFFHKRSIVFYLWATTLLYFLFPTIAGAMAEKFLFLQPVLKPMTTFTFAYGVHILDFCITLSLCLLLAKIPSLKFEGVSMVKNPFLLLIIILAYLLTVFPVVVKLFPPMVMFFEAHPILQYLLPVHFGEACWMVFIVTVCFWYLLFKPDYRWLKFLCSAGLILLGLMSTIACWRWFGKGHRVNAVLFQFHTPEHTIYRGLKGKFFMPYSWMPTMVDNYNLMFGVKSTTGFIPVPPRRYDQFLRFFNNRWDRAPTFEFRLIAPPASLSTFFPVDFTIIKKNEILYWPEFQKVVSGEVYDLWIRVVPSKRVLFADRLIVKELGDLMHDMFNKFFQSSLIIEAGDAQSMGIQETQLITLRRGEASYANFQQVRDDELSFDVMSKNAVFVMVPEMFQAGWQLFVDGQERSLFPAWYLFLGFQLEGGDHHIDLRFRPPGLSWGIFLNILAIVYIIGMLRFSKLCVLQSVDKTKELG